MTSPKHRSHRPHGADKWLDERENERRKSMRDVWLDLLRAMGYGLLAAVVLSALLAGIYHVLIV